MNSHPILCMRLLSLSTVLRMWSYLIFLAFKLSKFDAFDAHSHVYFLQIFLQLVSGTFFYLQYRTC